MKDKQNFLWFRPVFLKILRLRAKWRLERDRGPQRGSQALREDNNLKVLMLAVYTENRDRGTQVS